jgi:bacterioferritin-associated ferredoxin
MYTCICLAVTEDEVLETIEDGARTEDEVGERCGAGTGCGSCLDRICGLLTLADPDHGRLPVKVAV